MDIYVGDELGIDVAGKLRNEGYDNLLIFSTITPEYAIASYSVKANGYILKPFSGERIESVLNRVLEHYVRGLYQDKGTQQLCQYYVQRYYLYRKPQ